MAIALEVALKDACTQILDTSTLVRVVFSGRRRNMQTEFERLDIRPVEIKGVIQLQMSYNDSRATTVKNILPKTDEIMGLLSSGYANILVE